MRQIMCWLAICLVWLTSAESAAAAVQVYDARFVRTEGRPGHTGLFPILGAPVSGLRETVEVRLFGDVSTAKLIILSERSETLGTYILKKQDSVVPTSTSYLAESVAVPFQNFTYVIEGTDKSGGSFRVGPRVATSVQPAGIDVRIWPSYGLVLLGVRSDLTVNVTNYGAADTFSVSALASIPGAVVPQVQAIALGTNQSGAFRVSVTPTAQPTADLPALIRVAVELKSAAGITSNKATVSLPLEPRTASTLVVDVLPGSCDNPIQSVSKGVTPVAILGGADFKVNSIDLNTVRLAGIAPLKSSIEDVGSAAAPCGRFTKDKIPDLVLHFDTQQLVSALASLYPGVALIGQVVSLDVRAKSINGTRLVGFDDAVVK